MLLSSLILFVSLTIFAVSPDHFRGGTISWKYAGMGNRVEFKFKMAWKYLWGPGCTATKVGEFVHNIRAEFWECSEGCGPVIPVSDVNYYCVSANRKQNWEQGERTFIYSFPNKGPFTVSYTGGKWMKLSSVPEPGDWRLETVIDLHVRNDTMSPNSSPVTVGLPVYHLQQGCFNQIHILMSDPDGDRVRCRWSQGDECSSVCRVLPGAVLNEENCIMHVDASTMNGYVHGGWYAAAITVEDFPRSNIQKGDVILTPNDAMSSVPLQFLIHTPILNVSCESAPVFNSRNPLPGSTIRIPVNRTWTRKLYVSNPSRPETVIVSIILTMPKGMRQSPIHQDTTPNVYFCEITWKPTKEQVGQHLLCGVANDDKEKSSESYCFFVVVWETDVCSSQPCLNGGTCAHRESDFLCICADGFSGKDCAKKIDLCSSHPCQNGGICVNQRITFLCVCADGYSGETCATDINECLSNPCKNDGLCEDGINDYRCACKPGFSGKLCERGIDVCKYKPCHNSGTCIPDGFGYKCICPPHYEGKDCSRKISGNETCTSIHYGKCSCHIGKDSRNTDATETPVEVLMAGVAGFVVGLTFFFSSIFVINTIREDLTKSKVVKPADESVRENTPSAIQNIREEESRINKRETIEMRQRVSLTVNPK